MIFKVVKDPSAQVSALLAGDVDTFPGFQAPELVERLKKDARFAVVVGTTEGEVILATNNGKKPFDDLKVRQAMAHAINRDELIAAESGFGTPIGSHFAPHNKAYVDLTKTYPFDIAKGKALLAEAGYPNGFEASLKLPPVGYAQRAGEVLASQLGKIGIKVAITQLQWPQWLSEVFKERNYDLTIVAHTEANDLDRYARDGYYWNYNSPEFKAKWREVVAATDFAKRDELLKDCQRIIARDAVNGYLYQLAKIGVWKKELVGMWENSPTPAADYGRVLEVTLPVTPSAAQRSQDLPWRKVSPLRLAARGSGGRELHDRLPLPPPRRRSRHARPGDGRRLRRRRGAARRSGADHAGHRRAARYAGRVARAVRFRPAAARALPALDRRAAELRSRHQPRLWHVGRQADRRSPRRHPAARRAGAVLGAAGRHPARRVRRLEARHAGRLGRHGLHPDRHLDPEFLVRHRAGAGLRRDLADLPGRRLSRLAAGPAADRSTR